MDGTNTTDRNGTAARAEQIRTCLTMLHPPETVFEIRCLDVPLGRTYKGTASGYFDDIDAAVTCVSTIDDQHPAGIYTTINPCLPALLARANNRMVDRADKTTGDGEILRRAWLPIDIDPHRPSGIMASASERAASRELAGDIEDVLHAAGWSYPLIADSGSGTYLLYRIDQPNDAASLTLIKSFYTALNVALGKRDKTGIFAEIDETTCNAARILRVGGTMNGKAGETHDRPQRRCEYFSPVDECPVTTVTTEQIRTFVETYSMTTTTSFQKTSSTNGSRRLLVERWLADRQVKYKTKQLSDRLAYLLAECPFDSSHGTTDEVAIFQWSSGKLGAECKHNHCTGRDWHAFRDAIGAPDDHHYDPPKSNGKPSSATHPTPRSESPPTRQLIRTRMSDVTPRPVEWLWQDRLAAGKVTLFAGDAGLGKSTITTNIAASVSRGWTWPDGAPGCAPGNVIILSAEDGIEDTICPRLIAAKADLARIEAIQGVAFDEARLDRRVVNLKFDVPLLVEAINDLRDVKLVVIDPVSSYLDGCDTNKNGDVRSALQPLVDAAEQHGIAILLVTHLSKASARSALAAATGSLAFGALARQAHLVVADPDDATGERRLFLCMKSNVCRKPSGLSYSIRDGVLLWDADAVDVDADTALNQANHPDRRGKLDDATAWLLTLGLDRQPILASRIEELADQAGHSWRTVQRAFSTLNGERFRADFQGPYSWRIEGAK